MSKLKDFLLATTAVLMQISIMLILFLYSMSLRSRQPVLYNGESIPCKALSVEQNSLPIPRLGKMNALEIESDLKLLKKILEEAYVGARHLPHNHYQVLQQDLSSLMEEKITSSGALTQRLRKILKKVPDGHLNLLVDVAMNRSHLNSIFKNSEEIDWEESIVDEKSILTIRPYSFYTPLDQWEKFIEKFVENRDRFDAIVLDLRNNIGGQIGYANELAAELYGVGLNGSNFSQYFPMVVTDHLAHYTATSLIGMYNTVGSEWSKNLMIEGSLDSSLQEKLALCLDKRNPLVFDLSAHNIVSEKFDPSIAYKGKIFLLTGRRCFSACELFVTHMQAHPNVTTIGENTGGAIHYINPGLFTLPNTQISLFIPLSYLKFSEKMFEVVGIPPTVRMKNEADISNYIRNNL